MRWRRRLHCPALRDFCLRFLARDLPPDVCQRIEALAFVRDLADLAVALPAAMLIHAAHHRLAGKAGVLHTHMPYSTALI